MNSLQFNDDPGPNEPLDDRDTDLDDSEEADARRTAQQAALEADALSIAASDDGEHGGDTPHGQGDDAEYQDGGQFYELFIDDDAPLYEGGYREE